MTISCPYCAHSVALENPAPGKFTTRCPKCGKKFLLGISKDATRPPIVSGIRSEREGSETIVEAGSLTVPSPTEPSEGGGSTGEWTPNRDDDGSKTADWSSLPSPSRGEAHDPLATVPQATSPPARARTAATAVFSSDSETVAPAPQRPSAPPSSLDRTLGGYQLVKELGRGGMGSVYLARQVSLDRHVALKVMSDRFASDPTFVARFTREAYAAAQLVHHNVVQIYDFGEDKGTSYFSMEFVDGQALSAVLTSKTRLDPEEAVGYVFQAARGLKFAHDRSLIHRDVKPDNLMINAQGIVKVADLGLVKTLGVAEVAATGTGKASPSNDSAANLTRVDVAMGTPAYMAPEQTRDAASVDHRADIYSLGCTLYHLVTGRPPFEGKTAFELMSKHQTDAIVPPERIAKRVPKPLSDVILKMTAKDPEARHADLGAVIDELEGFLGVRSTGLFTPKEEHANLLEECAAKWAAEPRAKLKAPALIGVVAVSLLLAVAFALAGRASLAGGFLGLGAMTVAAFFVIDGFARRTHLFEKARELAIGGSIGDWLVISAGALLVAGLLWAFGLLLPWVGFSIAAVGIALGLHFGLGRAAERVRDEPLARVEDMLRAMRLQGLEEDNLRQFICKYAGTSWEGFYESLFGYEDKIVARDRWGKGSRGRALPKYGAWREPILARIDGKLRARKEAKDAQALQKVEEKSLEAQGENLVTARRKARRAAEAMVATASQARAADPRDAAVARSFAKAMREAASKPETALLDRERGLLGRSAGPIDLILGARARFLAGALLFAGCVAWMHQNGMLTKLQKVAETAIETKGSAGADQVGKALGGSAKPLSIPILPAPISRILGGFGAGVAGLVLLLSSFSRGIKPAFFAVPGAAVALLGPSLGVPTVGPLSAGHASMAIGAALGLSGFLFARRR